MNVAQVSRDLDPGRFSVWCPRCRRYVPVLPAADSAGTYVGHGQSAIFSGLEMKNRPCRSSGQVVASYVRGDGGAGGLLPPLAKAA